MKVKVGEITEIKTGKLDANASSTDGKYPFFTCSKDPLRINSYSYDCECVLVAGNGDLNVKYYNGKFDAYQRTYIIEDNSNGLLYMPYLYYFFEGYIGELRKQSIGGVIKYIKLGNLTDVLVELPSIEEQKYIVNLINISLELIELRKKTIDKLDSLVKARFIEMFGDPVANTKNWGQTLLKEHLESIKYGTSTPPIFTDDGYAFIRATNIKNGKIVTNDMKYIPQEEADRLEKCKLSGGEIIIVRSGVNAGDTCVVTDEYIGQYAGYDMILVLSSDLHPVFFNTLINTEYMDKVVKPLTRRAAQPHLNSEQIQRLPIIEVPFELQEQFADFVQQVDKSREAVKKSLEKTQQLYDSLMQEYFG